MSFVHLHCHTEYSLLDSSNKIKDYVTKLSELHMNAGAITDHGVMYGVIDFYKQAKEAGINPIIGCEVYVAPGSRFDKSGMQSQNRYYHLILLAENNIGYSNLSHIVSRSFTEGYYYKPRVDMELLNEYHEGLIALSACLAGEIPRAIVRKDYQAAVSIAKKYDDCFGHGNFFLELQDHGIPEQADVNSALLRISEELSIPLVATNDCHYTEISDSEAHDLLLCIQTQKKVTDEDRMRYVPGKFYIKSEEEMRALFPYAQEAIDNTQKIADRCHVDIEFGVTKLPHFDVPEGFDSWTYLNKLCLDGLHERYPEDDGSLHKKLDYELSIIQKMGYVDYFLIVWDYINFCRENGIAVGPGRGSAAGSIVSYCMHITNIDPIKYDLLFERFLNPERVSMPDIDVDFEYTRRQEVIDYVTKKYGSDKVVQIVTFGTLAARGVIRDVARVMDLPYSYGDGISKMIPNELGITLDKALELNPELKTLYETDETAHRLISMSKHLEGLPRHTSIHAAGVVICQAPAEDLVPLSRSSEGNITTQFTMTTIEELGLLKMDFLGLRTLTVIKDATEYANKSIGARKGDPSFIDIDKINFNDPEVLGLIGSGKCDGIFQLESAGMQSFMKELKPKSLEDIIAGISLYRPGPMDFIPKYIEGKNDASKIRYDTPLLESILAPTYGCIVYQEQVMQIVQKLGGYTLGRADLVRRAMSKKKQHVMEVERENFVHGNEKEGVPGCVANGIPEDIANKIYDSMMDFAKYAFNKSHAACYAVVAVQTAWLKYYYPVEFMAALMTSVIDNPSKVSGYIASCRNMNIKILPPDINEGQASFSVSEYTDKNGQKQKAIRYALTAIKNVGRPIISAVESERNLRGPFVDINDFLTRMQSTDTNSGEINKRAVENFIKSGALDSLGGNRKQHMLIYNQILDQLHETKNNMAGQMSLFDFAPEENKDQFKIKLPNAEEYPEDTLLEFEKDVLGIYISGHPLEQDLALMKRYVTGASTDFFLDDELGAAKVRDDQKVVIGGLIIEKKIKYTKNDRVMAFLQVEDLSGTIEVIVFPKTYEMYQSKLNADTKVFINGHASVEDDKDAKLIADRINTFEEMPKTLWLQFPDMASYEKKKKTIIGMLMSAPKKGSDTVAIYIKETKQIQKLPPGMFKASITADLLQEFSDIIGKENVKIS